MLLCYFVLCVGLLQQSAPELVACFRVCVDEFLVTGRKLIVNHDVHPFTVTPKREMEDAAVFFIRIRRVPILLLVVGYNLSK